MIVGEGEITINKDLYYVLLKANIADIKQVKKLIKSSHVYVNDICITDIKYQVNQYDKIRVDDTFVKYPFVYYMINKPKGYVCANSDKENKCITDLFEDEVNCIGRLDKDTTGLLLLTNDTNHVKRLLYPENHHKKKYLVTLDHTLNDDLVELFYKGVQLQNYLCLPAILEIIDVYNCYITIEEGKYHQIKKMFHKYGYKVVELHRMTFGPLVLDTNLKLGEYRKLNDEELKKLEESIRV